VQRLVGLSNISENHVACVMVCLWARHLIHRAMRSLTTVKAPVATHLISQSIDHFRHSGHPKEKAGSEPQAERSLKYAFPRGLAA